MSELNKLKKQYFENESLYLSEGLSWEAVERVGDKALLVIWDIFEIFKACKTIPDNGTYLEVGSHLGGSLCAAWEGVRVANRQNVRFISIDPFVSDAEWCKTYRERFDVYTAHIPNHTHIQKYSQAVHSEIADFSIDVLVVDGDHTYSKVKSDLINYWHKLKIGGLMLIHDYNYSPDHAGVVRAIMEVFNFQEYIHPFRSNLIIIKKEVINQGLFIW